MAGGLLGYAASMGQGINSLADWLEERARFAGGRVKRLATDPVGLLGTMAGEAGKSFTDFADAAARGDTGATVEGLLNSGLAGPLTFAGVGAKTADKVALQKAKQMANLGEDPVKIWQTTGWTEQFPDKQWRFEISDHNAYIPGKANESISNVMENARFGEVPRLKSVYKHPALEAAYPDFMQNTRINDFPADVMGGAQGSYRAPSNMQVASGLSVRDALPVIAHEGQHGIQGVEGFARGGSPEWNTATRSYWPPFAPSEDVLSAAEKLAELKKVHKLPVAEAARKYRAGFKIDDDLMKSAVDLVESGSLPKWQSELEKYRVGPYEAYRRLAGEAEARLTQARMNLTPAERMQHPPWLPGPYGFDVPPEQQIVRGLLGEQTGPAMQTVYHGTPHKFDRYSLSKIGTGEGAQAYGHGIYFAEKPDVAEAYQGMLSPMPRLANDGGVFSASTYAEMLAEARATGAGSVDKAIARTKETAPLGGRRPVDTLGRENVHDAGMRSRSSTHQVPPPVDAVHGQGDSNIEADILSSLYKLKDAGYKVTHGGYLYKQDLPDEVLPKMLQWDKPLSEQPEIMKRLMPLLDTPAVNKEMIPKFTGRDLLAMDGPLAQYVGPRRTPHEYSRILLAEGIPGLSYLDAGSRAGPINPISGGYYANKKRTMNHVVWDQELLNRMKPEPVGGLLGQQLGEQAGPAMSANPTKYGIAHRPMTVEGGAARLHDLTPSFGEDIYGKNAQQYFGGFDPREKAVLQKFKELRGKPDAEVTIYRGVPKNAEGKINPGDWVSLDKSVAEQAGEKVVSMKVKAKDITAWADSLLEQGYWPQGGGLLGQQ